MDRYIIYTLHNVICLHIRKERRRKRKDEEKEEKGKKQEKKKKHTLIYEPPNPSPRIHPSIHFPIYLNHAFLSSTFLSSPLNAHPIIHISTAPKSQNHKTIITKLKQVLINTLPPIAILLDPAVNAVLLAACPCPCPVLVPARDPDPEPEPGNVVELLLPWTFLLSSTAAFPPGEDDEDEEDGW